MIETNEIFYILAFAVVLLIFLEIIKNIKEVTALYCHTERLY